MQCASFAAERIQNVAISEVRFLITVVIAIDKNGFVENIGTTEDKEASSNSSQ